MLSWANRNKAETQSELSSLLHLSHLKYPPVCSQARTLSIGIRSTKKSDSSKTSRMAALSCQIGPSMIDLDLWYFKVPTLQAQATIYLPLNKMVTSGRILFHALPKKRLNLLKTTSFCSNTTRFGILFQMKKLRSHQPLPQTVRKNPFSPPQSTISTQVT